MREKEAEVVGRHLPGDGSMFKGAQSAKCHKVVLGNRNVGAWVGVWSLQRVTWANEIPLGAYRRRRVCVVLCLEQIETKAWRRRARASARDTDKVPPLRVDWHASRKDDDCTCRVVHHLRATEERGACDCATVPAIRDRQGRYGGGASDGNPPRPYLLMCQMELRKYVVL